MSIISGKYAIGDRILNGTAGIAFFHDSIIDDGGFGSGFIGMLTHHHRGEWKGYASKPSNVSNPLFGATAYHDNIVQNGSYGTRVSTAWVENDGVGGALIPDSGITGISPEPFTEFKYTGTPFAARVNSYDNVIWRFSMLGQATSKKYWRGGAFPWAGKVITGKLAYGKQANGITSFNLGSWQKKAGGVFTGFGTPVTGISAVGSGIGFASASVTAEAVPSDDFGPTFGVYHTDTDAPGANKYLDLLGMYMKWSNTGLHIYDCGRTGKSLWNYINASNVTAANLQAFLDGFECDMVVIEASYNDIDHAAGAGAAITSQADLEARILAVMDAAGPSALYGTRDFILIAMYDNPAHASTAVNNLMMRNAFANVAAARSNVLFMDFYTLLPDHTILAKENLYQTGVGGSERYTDDTHPGSHWFASQMNVAWNAMIEQSAAIVAASSGLIQVDIRSIGGSAAAAALLATNIANMDAPVSGISGDGSGDDITLGNNAIEIINS